MKERATFAAIRENQGFSIEQVAEFLCLPKEKINAWETGEGTIGIASIEMACELFGCTLSMIQGKEKLNLLPKIQNAHLMTREEMEVIRAANKIALNLRYMKRLEGEE